MRELFERVFSFVPQYIADITALVSRPKQFVLGRATSSERSLTDALSFFAMSFMIGWLLKVGFLKRDPVLDLASEAAFVMISAVGFGAAVCMAWRLVSGPINLKIIFTISFYYLGVTRLISACAFLILIGILKNGQPELYEELINAACAGRMTEFIQRHFDSWPMSLSIMGYIYCSLLLIWLMAGWGAYRDVMRSTRGRSCVALIAFILLSVVIDGCAFLVAEGAVVC
jgi:hypothetical protein